jgi:hypothetical protein
MKLLFMQILCPSVAYSLLRPNIVLSTLFFDILSVPPL